MKPINHTAPTAELAPLVEHWVQRRQQVSDHVMLIEHFDAITEIQSTLVAGVNKSSGKPYQRYDRTYITYAMRPTSTGRRLLRIFTKSSGPRKFSGVRDASLIRSGENLRDETGTAVERMISRLTGQELDLTPIGALRAHMYPILAAMGDQTRVRSVEAFQGIGGAFRLRTAQELTRALFGKKRYRKDLVRAVASARPWSIRIAYDLRTLMEVDWLVEFLRESVKQKAPILDYRLPGLKEVFAIIPKHRRRALLLAITTGADRPLLIVDAARMAQQVTATGLFDLGSIADCRTWKAIHDAIVTVTIATHEVKSAGERRAKIKRTPVTEALHGTEVAGFKLVTANNLDDLLLWGHALRNCIGSYFRQARTGHSNLFVLVADGKFAGNMEVASNGAIRQLVGFANEKLSPDDDLAITTHVRSTLELVLKATVTLAA